eukprot:900232-Prymnesium_polylepis.1
MACASVGGRCDTESPTWVWPMADAGARGRCLTRVWPMVRREDGVVHTHWPVANGAHTVRRKAVLERYAVLRCPPGTRYVTMRGLIGSRRVPSG